MFRTISLDGWVSFHEVGRLKVPYEETILSLVSPVLALYNFLQVLVRLGCVGLGPVEEVEVGGLSFVAGVLSTRIQ